MKLKHAILLWGILFCVLQSCDDHDELKADISNLKEQVQNLEKSMLGITTSAEALNQLNLGDVIVGVTSNGDSYTIELSNGNSYDFTAANFIKGFIPLISINEEGYWCYSTDNGESYVLLLDHNGYSMPAVVSDVDGNQSNTPELRVSHDGFWQISWDKGSTYSYLTYEGEKVSALSGESFSSIFSEVSYSEKERVLKIKLVTTDKSIIIPVIDTFFLKIKDELEAYSFTRNSTETLAIEQSKVQEAVIHAPEGWLVSLSEEELEIQAPKDGVLGIIQQIQITIVSSEGYLKNILIPVKLISTKYDNPAEAWIEFDNDLENNVLLDFSYAGYKHGEVAPPDVYSLGYKVYDITDYGATPNDGKSDRKAFIRALEAMGAVRGKDADAIRYQVNGGSAKSIIYFPEGEFILQGEEDQDKNKTIRMTFGDFVIKGAGRGKTILKMEVENEPTDPTKMWSCPVLLEIKHNSGMSELAQITQDSPKGGFSVEVSSTVKVKVGDWVCLMLENNDPELIKKSMLPYEATPTMTNMIEKGIQVYDYHQVVSVKGSTVTFKEPLMHEVEAKWNWKLMYFNHYENVGVEDLTFQGYAKSNFIHHGSAADDGGFKMLDFVRMTNSWMRRVDFISVSEASSVLNSANISVYDVKISGNRGHSAIRSAGSSRVFLGKIQDLSHENNGANIVENAGQFHACGVSKQSLGAVIWNAHWGTDACFESHATQPRATLIDHCLGAFMPWRQGGDENQLPNHMEDLTIWNMNATSVSYDQKWNNEFLWWDAKNRWQKNLPPTIIGFHGASIKFGDPENQIKRLESNGKKVEPASLYEAQLNRRLGYTPSWLLELK